MEQRSADWFAARLGKGHGVARRPTYAPEPRTAARAAAELHGRACCRAHHWHSAGGIHQRCDAVGCGQREQGRIAYEFYRDATVEEVGFVAHPSIADTGASPDGLVGADGLVEIRTLRRRDAVGRAIP